MRVFTWLRSHTLISERWSNFDESQSAITWMSLPGFARACGYRRVTLWTNDVLVAARTIYQQAGFHLVASQPHCDFGPPMVGEDWALTLR